MTVYVHLLYKGQREKSNHSDVPVISFVCLLCLLFFLFFFWRGGLCLQHPSLPKEKHGGTRGRKSISGGLAHPSLTLQTRRREAKKEKKKQDENGGVNKERREGARFGGENAHKRTASADVKRENKALTGCSQTVLHRPQESFQSHNSPFVSPDRGRKKQKKGKRSATEFVHTRTKQNGKEKKRKEKR